MAIDLNKWHHAVHQITGGMALRSNKAGADDLRRWAEELHRIATEMEAEADRCENELGDRVSVRTFSSFSRLVSSKALNRP
jgi:endogenous inhibitor of DNA gyrase (YacG/DUF329 family)